jgi:hypothetical protein
MLLQVMIWDDHQVKCIGELSFRSQVRAAPCYLQHTVTRATVAAVVAAVAEVGQVPCMSALAQRN